MSEVSFKLVQQKRHQRFRDGPSYEETLAGFETVEEKFMIEVQMKLQDLVDDYADKGVSVSDMLVELLPKAYASTATAMLYKARMPFSMYPEILSLVCENVTAACARIFTFLRDSGGPEGLATNANPVETENANRPTDQ